MNEMASIAVRNFLQYPCMNYNERNYAYIYCRDYDSKDRTIPIHKDLQEALRNDAHAQQVFESLAPSLQHEINRYITHLKSDAKVHENVQRAIDFLNGRGRFVGREL